jgi:AraC family transcriptional regulator of adaptative response/methylated-DNA-[protein]-cysteine methyltransferase
MQIKYGFHHTPFGPCLLGVIDDKICYLSFEDQETNYFTTGLKKQWPKYDLVLDQFFTKNFIHNIFSEDIDKKNKNFDLLFKGTEFQIRVWKTLESIAFGTTVSYSFVAHKIGKPSAVRAVANAIAKNNIAYLIPCHRVIAKSGATHKYRWGTERKKEMIEYEEKKWKEVKND